MATLNGEKIEELLWEQGIDFEHTEEGADVPAIQLTVGDKLVTVGETYVDQDGWHIDTDDLEIVRHDSDRFRGVDGSDIEDENALVKAILDVGLEY